MSRTLFLFPLFLLTLLVAGGTTVQAQALPAKVRTYLKKNYSGYKLFAGDRICETQAVVSGNFNDDAKPDYAVMLKKGQSGFVIAFLSQGANYKPHTLKSGSSGGINGSFLRVGRKGTEYAEIVNNLGDPRVSRRLKYDAPESGTCEASSYFWIYRNGTFRRAFTSD